jgi:hypothetical protein
MPRQSHSFLAAALLGAGLFTITAICPASTHAASSTIVITDPNAIVLGHTLTEWTAEYIRWAFAKPATGQPPGTTSAFNDPDGTYAETYNHGPMFFVTGGAPSMPSRTLNVPHGTLILFPISTLEDTEGPSIPPSIPGFVPSQGTYAQEVETVLKNSSFSDVVMKIDGEGVINLQESILPNFSAGVVKPGSEGQVFFTGPSNPLKPGTMLSPSGTEGYWVIIAGLSPGQHSINVGYTFISKYFGCPPPGCSASHTEFIDVGENQ